MPRGGARANSGGYRPGAGRKPRGYVKPAPVESAEPLLIPSAAPVAAPLPDSAQTDLEPLEFLRGVMLGKIIPTPMQLTAGIAAARLVHGPVAASKVGKKVERQTAAKTASGGKFKAAAPPLLVVNNR